MVFIFHDYMDIIMLVYLDDMLALLDYGWDLWAIFKRCQNFHLCLNLNKCVFKVTWWKMLGNIVSYDEIRIDPNKFKAIIEMPPPYT